MRPPERPDPKAFSGKKKQALAKAGGIRISVATNGAIMRWPQRHRLDIPEKVKARARGPGLPLNSWCDGTRALQARSRHLLESLGDAFLDRLGRVCRHLLGHRGELLALRGERLKLLAHMGGG